MWPFDKVMSSLLHLIHQWKINLQRSKAGAAASEKLPSPTHWIFKYATLIHP